MEVVLNEVGLAVLVGLLILLAFLFANCFQAALRPKSYDEVLSELKQDQSNGKKAPTSPKKKTKRSGSKRINAVNGDDLGEDGKPRFKRAESLKNEHVVFADEISPEDEKFSPPDAGEIEAKS